MDTLVLGSSALRAFQEEMRVAPDHSPILAVTYVRVIDAMGCETTYPRALAHVEDGDVLVVTSIDDPEYQSLWKAGTWRRAAIEDGYGPIASFTPEQPLPTFTLEPEVLAAINGGS